MVSIQKYKHTLIENDYESGQSFSIKGFFNFDPEKLHANIGGLNKVHFHN